MRARSAEAVESHQPLLRREDDRLLRGKGRFVHHLTFANMQFVAFVRATQMDASFALPTVDPSTKALTFFSAQELGAIVLPTPNPVLPPVSEDVDHVLPMDTVNYVGQPIALVVAPDCCLARDHAEQIATSIQYAPTHRRVNNPRYTAEFIDQSAVTRANVRHLTKLSFRHHQPLIQPAPLEARASIAHWHDQVLTFYTGTQAPARARDMLINVLAQALNVPTAQLHERVRVIAPDVGGAFGAKASLYPEDFALALTAWKLQTTLKWVADRSEDFLSGTLGRGAKLEASLQVDNNGIFHSLQAHFEFALGAWLPFSAAVPLRNATRILPGPYQMDTIHITGNATRAPHAAVNIYRGAGRPEAALVHERLVDDAARALRIDPIELRRRNLIAATMMPYRTPTGETFDSGDFDRLLSAAADAFDYQQARAQQHDRNHRAERVGIGIALYVEPCGQGFETAQVVLHEDGMVDIVSGAPAQGQGHETTFAQIASEALNVPTAQIRVHLGDTHRSPQGIGALASRSIAIGGSAILRACEQARQRRSEGAAFPIEINENYVAPMEAWSSGCVIAQVAVDCETGVPSIEKIVWADDAGRIISPPLVHGQLIGGLAQGFGQAMMEAIVYDEAGQLLTGSLMDYALPRASDMPLVTIVSIGSPSTANALGAKGVGEAGCIGVPAALLNATCDALSEFDTRELSFPLTSEKIWSILCSTPRSSI